MSQTFRTFRYFDKEYTFDEWVRREILKNKGTDNIAQTKDLEKICSEIGITHKNNISKAELFDLLLQAGFSSEKFAKRFAIGVGSHAFQDTFGITNEDVKRLERHGALTVVSKERYRAFGKNCYAPLYDLTEICHLTDEDMQALLKAYPKQVRRKKPVPSQPYQQEDYEYEPEEEIER